MNRFMLGCGGVVYIVQEVMKSYIRILIRQMPKQ